MDEVETFAREQEEAGHVPLGFYDWLASYRARLPSEGDQFFDKNGLWWRYHCLRWEKMH